VCGCVEDAASFIIDANMTNVPPQRAPVSVYTLNAKLDVLFTSHAVVQTQIDCVSVYRVGQLK